MKNSGRFDQIIKVRRRISQNAWVRERAGQIAKARRRIGKILRFVYRDARVRAAAAGVSACVWWGLFYPELCFTQATCEQVVTDGGAETDGGDVSGIMGASDDELVIRSRLWEWIEQKITDSK